MRVLVACELYGKVRKAFRSRGHDAWSCDLLPAKDENRFHIPVNVLRILHLNWELLIAHPPCTRLCNSGVRWLHERDLWNDMKEAARLFNKLLTCSIPKIAIENPIPHKYAVDEIGRKYDQIIQPWQFGHPETKATCLWLKNLPKLQPTNIVEGRENRIHKMSPSKRRGELRSITYQGIALAMAEQWG